MNVPQLDFSTYPSQIFWLLVCVVFLFSFIKNVFLPRVTATLEARERRVQGDKDRALEARTQAKRLKQDYDEKVLENKKAARHEAEKGLSEFQTMRDRRFQSLQREFVERCAALEGESFVEERVDQNFVSILLEKRK